MRKETINTFSDGMSLDLNPLGTPAKTLTNCLNGTLITYNGNELTLQNDMGNTKVGTAALPKGYVPVGMKEYGGIIYVASYNPETKKGQIGCFPSPQQIYTSEAAQTVVDLNILTIFIEMINNLPFIKFNEYKEEIFKDSITLEPKIFNSGDLFIIKTDENFSELLRQAIDDNIIYIKLQILPSLGGDIIDITDCDAFQLKCYEDITNHKNLWIFQNGGNMYEGILKNIPFDILIQEYPLFLLSYPKNIGPGTIQLCLEFNMFKLFNLYNKIEKSAEGFNVLFIGHAEADDLNPCAIVEERSLAPIGLFGSINYTQHEDINRFKEISLVNDYISSMAISERFEIKRNQELFYDLLPASKWGIADKTFLKSGKLSYSLILNYLDKITDWNFEINSSDALIKWKFISLSNNIDHLRFVFIPLDLVLDNDNNIKNKNLLDTFYISGASTENSLYIYKIVKPYFSGDFEDMFPIDAEHLAKNYIYLCRIDIIYQDKTVKNASDYKLLYTGTFFNGKDITLFDYYNRPEVLIEVGTTLLLELTILNRDYTIIKENQFGIISKNKPDVEPSDIMLLADKENLNKLIGAVSNIEYEIKSTLNIDTNKNIKYEDKIYTLSSFSGVFDESKLLEAFDSLDTIVFGVSSDTEYSYNQIGDSAIEQCKKDYIELEELNGLKINNSRLNFVKDSSNKYINTCTVKIHRGIISRFGQPEDINVIHLGLYPVYEEEDRAYNDLLFGFKIDDDFIYNCVLFKEDSVHNYLANILGLDKILNGNDYPYSENATIQRNSGFISQATEYDKEDLFKTLLNMGNKPINICVTNSRQSLYDDEFEIGAFRYLLTMPHEISFNETSETGVVWSKHEMSPHAKHFKENNLGYSSWEDLQAFFRTDYTNNCMSIIWRTLYGPRLINVATPLNIENEDSEDEVITIKKKKGTDDKFTIYSDNKKHTFSNMHLRAEKLLLCMLSQILIAKCKNSTLRLNTPDTLYSTEYFANSLLLSLNKTNTISLNLNGKDIEKAIYGLRIIKVLENEDIFIPKFNATITNTHLTVKEREYDSKIHNIFSGAEWPYFSSISDKELKNIYPGKIVSLENGYICKLEKNYDGTYAKNTSLIDSKDKFYKIFLPTLISEVNNPESLFNCTNTENYKFILEGLAYNDILLPTTRILEMQNVKVNLLRSLDSKNPQFNLLYYNALTKQHYSTGAVTIFGDLSAYVNTENFNNTGDFYDDAPKINWSTWRNVEVLLDKKSTESPEENIEEQ